MALGSPGCEKQRGGGSMGPRGVPPSEGCICAELSQGLVGSAPSRGSRMGLRMTAKPVGLPWAWALPGRLFPHGLHHSVPPTALCKTCWESPGLGSLSAPTTWACPRHPHLGTWVPKPSPALCLPDLPRVARSSCTFS